MKNIKNVDSHQLAIWLNKKQCILIDVREPFEYNESHIKQAINIPLSQLLVKINELTDLKNKKIVMQCKAGVRSMMGCEILAKDGFTQNIWNLQGGIQDWIEMGGPVVSAGNK